MEPQKKDIRKLLGAKIHQLNNIIADMDALLSSMETEHYRVSIFGSARIDEASVNYSKVYDLAYQLGIRGIDVVTGGGPGLMAAANKGAKAAGKAGRSIGLAIDLPFEIKANEHLDVTRQHKRFSSRLDEFMRISHAIVVTPGGVGTLLEFLFTWQVLQVSHKDFKPIFLLEGDGMWAELMNWFRKWVESNGLMLKEDFRFITLCSNVAEVVAAIEHKHLDFKNKLTEQS